MTQLSKARAGRIAALSKLEERRDNTFQSSRAKVLSRPVMPFPPLG